MLNQNKGDGVKINVLDKGYIELIDHMGNDKSIVNSAKISYANDNNEYELDDNLTKNDVKILEKMTGDNFLHWTPFAQTSIKLKIKMPIFIARQWFKHNVGFVRNELSRRYTKKNFDFYVPEVDKFVQIGIESTYTTVLNYYNVLLEAGIKPEQARTVLPQGTYTEFYETANLMGYFNLYKQRIDNHAQAEIQEYAKAIDEIMLELFPESWKMLKKRGN